VQRGVAVIGIVGERVATAAGILVRVARCLEKMRLESLAVLQGASPHSLVIALPDDERLPGVLRLLHTELGLDCSNRRRECSCST
jgi:aspartokinase